MPHLSQHLDQGGDAARTLAGFGERLFVERLGGLHCQRVPRGSELDEGRARVGRVRTPSDQFGDFEALNGAGDAGAVDLQAGPGGAHRQRPASAEVQQDQDLVPGNCDSVRLSTFSTWARSMR